MAVDERTRRIMTQGLVRTLGEEVTDALLAHLPPAGWGEVATKQDLAALEISLTNALRAEFQTELRLAITQQTRTLMLGVLGAILTVAVVAFGAPRLG